ncbi:MAG: methyltransferase domain-containing protein [Anaerolineales bacterium]|nr:methyltransferase domain-containing protein [Anaerolineales bacterium]
MNPLISWDYPQKEWIICNFCGTVFHRASVNHSEFLACPNCDAIARERVAYQCILNEIYRRFGVARLFIGQSNELSQWKMLECSPRHNDTRRKIYQDTFGHYLASDFDLRTHRADIKIDLTNQDDISQFPEAFDLILCSHVLEHIPDYKQALQNLHFMLAPGGLLILQVPLLEGEYTPVTWEEFHADNTPVFHRFSFDLLLDLDSFFSQATAVVGRLKFRIRSPEIAKNKYDFLNKNQERCLILGAQLSRYYGLGAPDLCDAFIAYK